MGDVTIDTGLSDPSTIYTNDPSMQTSGDAAGDIASGSFGNNGGSTGDNGANGPGGSTTDNGPPTQADVDLYKQQLKEANPGWTDAQVNQHVSTMLGNVTSAHPEWATALSPLIKAAASGVTTGITNPGNTTPGGSPTGSGGLGTTNTAMLFPALATAYQQYKNAGQYTQQAEKYAGVLNPYGAYRDAAAQKLAALQADPSSIVNTPGYQFSLSQGLGAVANRDNRSFGVGAGSTNPDMMTFAQGLAQKTYNDTINQYSQQAGVNIGPSAAASILQTGMQGNIASQSNAVNALLSPFGPGNNTGGGNTVDTASVIKNLFGGAQPPGTPGAYTYDPNNDPGKIVNNQQTPSVPYDPSNDTANDLGSTVPNNNTGVAPGGT
jgi:hypothetical protein